MAIINNKKYSLCTAMVLVGQVLLASSINAQAEPSDDDIERENKAVLDENPILAPRTQGMAGAVSPVADSIDAANYNPAGIGGVQWGRERPPTIRQLHFPYVGASINKNSQDLVEEMNKKGGASDVEIGKAVVDAHEGKRQYGRVSLFPNIGVGRLMMGPIMDMQLAAVPLGQGTDLVDTHYQERTGFGLGLSIADYKERLYIGVFSHYLSIKDVRGEFLYSDMIDKNRRSEVLDEGTSTYSGIANNIGMMWRLAETAKPTLSLVARNVGGTSYSKQSGEGEDLSYEQDLTFGMGVSPPLGKIGVFNFVIEGTRLTDEEVAVQKKWRVGSELALGGQAQRSIFSLRAGANDAGASFGGLLNLGLIGIQYANMAEDLGRDNTRLIERRQSVSVQIDVAAP